MRKSTGISIFKPLHRFADRGGLSNGEFVAGFESKGLPTAPGEAGLRLGAPRDAQKCQVSNGILRHFSLPLILPAFGSALHCALYRRYRKPGPIRSKLANNRASDGSWRDQPVVAGVIDQRPPGFTNRCCKLVSDECRIFYGERQPSPQVAQVVGY